MRSLAGYTRNPSEHLRHELLDVLSRAPETLIVVNHPLWDQTHVGAEHHRAALGELLASSNGSIHALEVNGLRSWKENRAVLEAACALDRPVVSGGDRHGCEPTAIVNLTRAADFSEFAAEVRGGASEVAVLERYREPLRYRILKSVFDIMREYPELPGRVRWSDRVFCQIYSGAIQPMSQIWNGHTPQVVRYFERGVKLSGNREIQNLLRLSLADGKGPERL
ncbi:MAG: hypothetical protein HY822_23660 [Acidobacteria bacterium]|nr:hypothetical protein [Acidobacteriota bacterium]